MKKLLLCSMLVCCALLMSCGEEAKAAKLAKDAQKQAEKLAKELLEQSEDYADELLGETKKTKSASNKGLLGSELYVQENLRLRQKESTDSNIITTMAFGTKVKVIEVGKKDSVEDSSGKEVKGNWIRVEIDHTTYDRNGKLLKGGTTGWCFSGYLAESLSHKNLIGFWKNKEVGYCFSKDGSGYWEDLEYDEGGCGFTWYADENYIYMTPEWKGEVGDTKQFSIIYLEKDAFGFMFDGYKTELVRTKGF